MMLPYYIACAVVGYLIGSIPFGYIIVKLFKGIDIRTVGSGNIGATNVARVLGVFWGIVCFLLDTAKGFFPTYCVIGDPLRVVAGIIESEYKAEHPGTICIFLYPVLDYTGGIFIGLGTIIGHLFPFYLRFRGGKGVATSLGVFLALTLLPTIMAIVIWLIIFLLLRYVSIASICAAISLPLNLWLIVKLFCPPEIYWEWWKGLFLVRITCILASALVLLRHIPNIKRLIKGTEPKVNLWKRRISSS